MKVRAIMTQTVFTVTPEIPLKVAATRLLEYGISGMPVVNHDRVVGVISETDVLFKERSAPDREGLVDWLLHYGDDPPAAKLGARTVGDAMTSPAVTIGPGKSVADAAALMLDLGIDRLPVVEAEELVGIVTRADLVRAFVRGDKEIQQEIKDGVILKTLWVNPGRVTVRVEDGRVTLRGFVGSAGEAEQILRLVDRVPGVVDVESTLTWPEGAPNDARGRTGVPA
jgi:CBS domain-containing protein